MSSRSKATIASSLANDLETALVQNRAQAGAALSFPDVLTSLECAGPDPGRRASSPVVRAIVARGSTASGDWTSLEVQPAVPELSRVHPGRRR